MAQASTLVPLQSIIVPELAKSRGKIGRLDAIGWAKHIRVFAWKHQRPSGQSRSRDGHGYDNTEHESYRC